MDTTSLKTVTLVTLVILFVYIITDFLSMASAEYLRDMQRVEHLNQEAIDEFLVGISLALLSNIIVLLYMFILNKFKAINKASIIIIGIIVLISIILNMFSLLISEGLKDELLYSNYILTIEWASLIFKITILLFVMILYKKYKKWLKTSQIINHK